MQAGAIHDADRDRRAHARCRRRSPSSARARSATSSPASRTSARPAPARRSPTATHGADRGRSTATATRSRWCSAASTRSTATTSRTCARRSRSCKLNDASHHLRARDVGRARLRLPLRLPRPAAHGDRPGAPRARVRPRPHRHRAVASSTGCTRTDGELIESSTTRPTCPTPQKIDYIEEPYFTVTILTPDGLHGHADGAVPDRGGARWRSSSTCRPSGSSCIYRIPLAEVVVDFFDQLKSRTPGLRQPRLRARRLPTGRTW